MGWRLYHEDQVRKRESELRQNKRESKSVDFDGVDKYITPPFQRLANKRHRLIHLYYRASGIIDKVRTWRLK